MDQPTGRYDEQGAFYFDIPLDLTRTTYVLALRQVLAKNLPPDTLDYDEMPYPMTIWCDWRYAPRAEQIARLFFPALKVAAAGNPHYRGPRETRDLATQLGAARRAIVAAEALVRCGVEVAG